MDFFKYLHDELNLNPNAQQREAIHAPEKRILLEACPGSGKTTTLVARLGYLIIHEKICPTDILTLTFSRFTARDMENGSLDCLVIELTILLVFPLFIASVIGFYSIARVQEFLKYLS